MRGLAAVLVVLFHAQVVVGQNPVDGIMGRILSNGALGVDIFFVLSGFIITLVHQADLGRPDRCARYLWRRFSRIYPAVFIMSALALATYLTGAHASETQKLNAWSVVASFVLLPQANIPLVNVTWTLVVANAGPSNAQNVVISDELPANVSFVSAEATASSSCSNQSRFLSSSHTCQPL